MIPHTFFLSSTSYQQDEEQSDSSQLGELTPIKTAEGNQISVYLRTGNRLLFCSGKYFYIEHTVCGLLLSRYRH